MKLQFLSMILIAFTILSTTSCSDSKESIIEEMNNSVITVSTNEYPLDYAYSLVSQNDNNGYSHFVFLTSEGITNVDGDFLGKGNLLVLNFTSSLSTGIPDGTYNFLDTEELMTCQGGNFMADYDLDLNTIDDMEELSFDSVEVENDGEQIQISFDYTGMSGENGNCNFKGKLIIIE